MSRWVTIKSDQIKKVPKVPGVFAVYVLDGLSYIGQSLNLRHRVEDYFKNNIYYKEVDPKTCKLKISLSRTAYDWVVRESKLVLRLSPPWNRPGVSWRKFRSLKDKGNGYLEYLEREFVVDADCEWLLTLRERGLPNYEIARYINKCKTSKKRWTPIMVRNLLLRYDKDQANQQAELDQAA